MRALVTGAAGFLGSNLLRLLIGQNHEVHAVLRKATDKWRILDVLNSVKVIEGDLLDCSRLQPALEAVRPDICFHLAWYAMPGKYLTAHENLQMVDATARITQILGKAGCAKLIVPGTCLEYETVDRNRLTEKNPTNPKTLYAACKLATFHIVSQLADEMGMSLAWARLFFQYGPYENPQRLVPSVICSLLRNEHFKITHGNLVRDFLHIEDTARALIALADNDVSGPVNIGSGTPISIRAIATKIGSIIGRSDLIEFDTLPTASSEPPFICADNSLLMRATGWTPHYDIDSGLEHTLAWWKGQIGDLLEN